MSKKNKSKCEGKEPLKSMIMTGYMKMDMQEVIHNNTEKMLSCINLTLNKMNAEAGEEIVQRIDIANFVQKIHELRAKASELDVEHKVVSEKLQKEFGYRKIVSGDSQHLGVKSR